MHLGWRARNYQRESHTLEKLPAKKLPGSPLPASGLWMPATRPEPEPTLSCGLSGYRCNRGVDSLQYLNEDLRMPVESLHHPVHDLGHVVEIDVQVRLGHHTDYAELHLLDPDVDSGGELHEVHRVRIESDVRSHVGDREADRIDRQLGNLEDHVAIRRKGGRCGEGSLWCRLLRG